MSMHRAKKALLAALAVIFCWSILTALTPVPTPSPWKFTKSVWKYQSDEQSLAWYAAEGFDGFQCWSPEPRPALPSCAEIRTSAWPMTRIEGWINEADPLRFGFNVDCEVPRTHLTYQVVDMIHAKGLMAFTGPIPWQLQPQDYFARFDGIMTFYNVSGINRFPADVFYFIACAAYYDKPLCMGIQPVYSGGAPVDPESLSAGLAYASNASARIIWGTDRLVGSTDAQVLAVSQAIATWPTDIPRVPITVRFANNWKKDMALCRIVAYKGYLPHASLTEGVTWSSFVVPSDYYTNLVRFYDGWQLKATVESQERSMVWRWQPHT